MARGRGGGRRRGGGGRRYKRDSKGRFAGSYAASKGFARTRRVDPRGRTYTRANKARRGSGSGRQYVTVSRSGRTRQNAVVQQVKGGRATPQAPANNRITRSAVGRLGTKPGAPVPGTGGNVRYVSRGHAILRASSLPGSKKRAIGRARSQTLIKRATNQGRPPDSGYIVTYL